MAKYLIEAAYTVEGLHGLLQDGGSKRQAALDKAIQNLGGTMESFYYVFGEDDVILVADLADNTAAAALSLAISAAGAATATVRVLLTPAEIDAATKKTVDYTAPGG